jgi:hypothetical protein
VSGRWWLQPCNAGFQPARPRQHDEGAKCECQDESADRNVAILAALPQWPASIRLVSYAGFQPAMRCQHKEVRAAQCELPHCSENHTPYPRTSPSTNHVHHTPVAHEQRPGYLTRAHSHPRSAW